MNGRDYANCQAVTINSRPRPRTTANRLMPARMGLYVSVMISKEIQKQISAIQKLESEEQMAEKNLKECILSVVQQQPALKKAKIADVSGESNGPMLKSILKRAGLKE